MTRSHDTRGYDAVWRLHFIAGLLVLALVVTPLALILPLAVGSLMFAIALDLVLQRLAPRLAVQPGAQP